MATEEVTVEICDNPKCRKTSILDSTPAIGYHFTEIVWARPSGGNSVLDIYACKETCIRPAIAEAFRYEQEVGRR